MGEKTDFETFIEFVCSITACIAAIVFLDNALEVWPDKYDKVIYPAGLWLIFKS